MAVRIWSNEREDSKRRGMVCGSGLETARSGLLHSNIPSGKKNTFPGNAEIQQTLFSKWSLCFECFF